MSKKRIVCFGPGPKFKGGIANYNTSLAKALEKQGAEVHIVSWTNQYPSIIPRDFIDKSSKADLLEGTNIKVTYITNYNNPLSWRQTFKVIRDLKPDMVIFQWAIALQGLPMGRIARLLKKKTNIEVVWDCHLVVQKEASSLDKRFTRYGLKVGDTYVTHSQKTSDELTSTFPKAKFVQNVDGQRAAGGASTIIKLYHPVYNMFQPDPNFDLAAWKEKLNLKENVFLFFGFIRKYKGLHHCIRSFAKLAEQRDDVSLLIVGESFWGTLDNKKFSTKVKNFLFGIAKSIFLRKSDDEKDYNPLALIDELGIRDITTSVNEYVPNEDVHIYFQASDCIVLFYETATPSGVESMAYNFDMPILATKVGHFPETVKHGYNGYLAEAEDVNSMTETMKTFLEKPIDRKNVGETASEMSWENYADAILNT